MNGYKGTAQPWYNCGNKVCQSKGYDRASSGFVRGISRSIKSDLDGHSIIISHTTGFNI